MLGLFKPKRPKLVAFDIIETVFSIEPLRPALEGLGLPGTALEQLYADSIRDAMALACSGGYAPFLLVMKAALGQLLAAHELSATEDELTETLGLMRALPPYEDAKPAFELLRREGLRVVALSNGAISTTRTLLDKAGMSDLVEQVFSTDDVKTAKPRPEVYRHLLKATGLEPPEAMLVACHPWDVNGAKSAGLLGGYVCRSRPYPETIMKAPDVEGDSLVEVARAAVEMRS